MVCAASRLLSMFDKKCKQTIPCGRKTFAPRSNSLRNITSSTSPVPTVVGFGKASLMVSKAAGKSGLVFARLFLLPQHKGHPRHRHRQEKKMVKHMMVEDNDNNVLSYDGNGLTWQPRTIILTHCSGVKAHYLHRLPGSGYLLEFPFSVPNPHTRPAWGLDPTKLLQLHPVQGTWIAPRNRLKQFKKFN